MDLLCLLFLITKMIKSKGMISLEQHIEKPEDSTIFKRFPPHRQGSLRGWRSSATRLRMMTMSLEDPHQVEIGHGEAARKASSRGACRRQRAADDGGRFCLRLVSSAAVLGVIKTMGAISEPPEVLGKMIGSALVGTFMGVFLAYGIVGPMGARA